MLSSEEIPQENSNQPIEDDEARSKNQTLWSDRILKFLLEYRKTHPEIIFRLQKGEGSLKSGGWFDTEDGNGIIIDFIYSSPMRAMLEIVTATYNPTAYLSVRLDPTMDGSEIDYDQIIKNYLGADAGFKQYSEKDVYSSISNFLENDYPLLVTFMSEYFPDEPIHISEEEFEKDLEKVLKYRDKLYPFDSINGNKIGDNVKLQKDAAALQDLLGRKPFVDALANYIFKMWETEQDHEPYTVHLSGEWGSGKTSILNFLEGNLKEKGWSVVKFNAWQNQYMDPPWWILLDNVYRQLYREKSWPKNWFLWMKEMTWRVFTINGSAWWAFVGFLALTLVIIKADFVPHWFYALFPSVESTDSLKTISSLFALTGTIWAFIRGVNNSLLPGSSQAAQNFQKNAHDPMKQVKSHFDSLVKSTDQKLAIFLDDVDRCEPKFLVQLLEGIQTLFKNSRTLYIVSGDGAWLRHCFEIHYEKFNGIVKKPGHSLGNSFLEKIFQMSISVPAMSEISKQNYWNYLLGHKADTSSDPKMEHQAKIEMASAHDEKEVDELTQKYKSQPMEPYIRKAAVEKLSEKTIQENIEHRLTKFASEVNANPRSMKRLINRYSLIRQSMILKGVSFNEVSLDELAHWIIFQSKYPVYGERLKENPGLINANFLEEPQLFNAISEIKPYLSEMTIELITSG